MTIELITGAPGSGKTTFGVGRRLVEEVKRELRPTDEECLKLGVSPGTVFPRKAIVGGVGGLLVEHERMPHTLTGESVPQGEIDFGTPCILLAMRRKVSRCSSA